MWVDGLRVVALEAAMPMTPVELKDTLVFLNITVNKITPNLLFTACPRTLDCHVGLLTLPLEPFQRFE